MAWSMLPWLKRALRTGSPLEVDTMMRMTRVRVFGLFATTAAVLESALSVWAQGTTDGRNPAMPVADPAFGGTGMAVGVVMIAVVVIGLAVMVKVFDARRRREDRIAGVQGRLSDVLAGDPMFARLPLIVTVQAPGWGSRTATVVISGTAPSSDVREAAERVVELEAMQRLEEFRTVNRVLLDPQLLRRAA
jgi:hypothetical protein